MSSPDPHQVKPGDAPTPYTADQIRAGCPLGRTITLSVEGEGGAYLRTIRFVAVDDEGALQESVARTEDGEPLGDPSIARTSWDELQEHASFPSGATTVEPEALHSPMGRLECRVYRVEQGDSVDRFWFAVDRPGMPVKVEKQSAGRVTSTVTMIDDTVT